MYTQTHRHQKVHIYIVSSERQKWLWLQCHNDSFTLKSRQATSESTYFFLGKLFIILKNMKGKQTEKWYFVNQWQKWCENNLVCYAPLDHWIRSACAEEDVHRRWSCRCKINWKKMDRIWYQDRLHKHQYFSGIWWHILCILHPRSSREAE